MNYNFFIVGGDLRILYLAKLLKKEGHNVQLLGFEKVPISELQDSNVEIAKSIYEIEKKDIIITSIPLSLDGKNIYAPYSSKELPLKLLKGKSFIAGKITKDIINKIYDDERIDLTQQKIKLYDILTDEPNIIYNTLPTAEGAIAKAIEDTKICITNSNVLVLGFGKVGKTLCKKLQEIGTNVYAEARKEADLAWIEVCGYNPIPLTELKNNICKMDIIFNTVPHMIIEKDTLVLMKKDTLIIDLASKPGGVDFKSAEELGIKAYLYSGIPGKVAPKTSAEYILKYVNKVLKEKSE